MGARRPLGAGGLTKKTGTYVNADGDQVPYTYWQASREVPVEKLPKGLSRKRVTGSGPTKKDALARLEANWDAFERGESSRGATRLSGKMTVRRLYEEWDRNNLAGAVTPVQARAYQGIFNNHILPALGDMRLDALGETDLIFFFNKTLPAKKKENGSPLLGGSARRNIYMALSAALTFAVRNRYLPVSPLAGVDAPKKVKPQEDIDSFLRDAHKVREEILSGDHPDETRWLLTLLGLRQSERLGLTWSSIQGLDTDSPSLVVANQLHRIKGEGLSLKPTTKSGKPRRIRLVEPWISSLRAYRKDWLKMTKADGYKAQPAPLSDLLFIQPNGRPMSHKQDTDDWHELLNECGVSYWRQHLMRHYTAVMLAEQPSIAINDVMSILGHDTEALSVYYSHADQGRKTQALQAYGAAVKPTAPKKGKGTATRQAK